MRASLAAHHMPGYHAEIIAAQCSFAPHAAYGSRRAAARISRASAHRRSDLLFVLRAPRCWNLGIAHRAAAGALIVAATRVFSAHCRMYRWIAHIAYWNAAIFSCLITCALAAPAAAPLLRCCCTFSSFGMRIPIAPRTSRFAAALHALRFCAIAVAPRSRVCTSGFSARRRCAGYNIASRRAAHSARGIRVCARTLRIRALAHAPHAHAGASLVACRVTRCARICAGTGCTPDARAHALPLSPLHLALDTLRTRRAPRTRYVLPGRCLPATRFCRCAGIALCARLYRVLRACAAARLALAGIFPRLRRAAHIFRYLLPDTPLPATPAPLHCHTACSPACLPALTHLTQTWLGQTDRTQWEGLCNLLGVHFPAQTSLPQVEKRKKKGIRKRIYLGLAPSLLFIPFLCFSQHLPSLLVTSLSPFSFPVHTILLGTFLFSKHAWHFHHCIQHHCTHSVCSSLAACCRKLNAALLSLSSSSGTVKVRSHRLLSSEYHGDMERSSSCSSRQKVWDYTPVPFPYWL